MFRAIVQKTFLKFLSILFPKKFLLYKEKIRKIKGQFDLGLGGNWKTSYSSGMVGYWNFSIADGTDSPTTSDLYDLSGNSRDMTAAGSIAAISTGFTPTNASKRLTPLLSANDFALSKELLPIPRLGELMTRKTPIWNKGDSE